jgi:hypothetical protein
MTQPTPEDAKAAAEKAEKVKAAQKVDLLTVGHYRRKDPILGFDHDEFGVVTSVGDGILTVRPLREHEHQVDPADFTPLSPDDVA